MAARRELMGFERRKVILTVVLAVGFAAAAIALIGQAADFGKMLDALERADKPWFALCVGGQLLAYTGYLMAYRDTARVDGGPLLPVWTAMRVVGLGFGAYVVGSAPGGLAVDFWALHRAGSSVHEAARRVLAFNTMEWAVLSLMAVVASVFVLLGRGEGAPLPMTLAWIIAVPVAYGLAAYVSSPRRAERLTRIEHDEPASLDRDPRKWSRWSAAKLRKGFADAVGGLVLIRKLVGRPRTYWKGLLGFPLYWTGQLLTLYAALHAFTRGEGLVISALVLAYVTGYVATALPLPAGGSGSIEASLALTLHLVGVPLAPALLSALVYRFFTFWLPLIPALALLPTVPRLNTELPRVARARS